MSTPRRSSSDAAAGTLTLTLTQSINNQLVQPQFTDEDELNLLNCYLQISRSNNSHPTLDSPTLDRIQAALRPSTTTTTTFTYSHSHIADKLHRLKLQYHKFARTKSYIKTPHHRHILDIGRTIWGKSTTPRIKPPPIPRIFSRRVTQQRSPPAPNKPLHLNNFPLLLTQFSRQFPGNGVWKKGLHQMEEASLKSMNQNWVLLHIQETELKARRAALLQRQFGITHTSQHD